MPDGATHRVARLLRVPPDPEPPPGDPSSVRVFRAAPGYYRLKLVRWFLAQLGTLTGLLVGLFVLDRLDWFESGWLGVGVTGLEIVAWAAFLAQLPFSLAALRLDYAFRWYMLSDRALRIREGVLTVRERTMTFANIQRLAVRQGPLERLLGVADLEVSTAGGGGSSDDDGSHDLHRAYLRGVADPEAIRDTIRDRVQRYRDSGLGDPDEPPGPAGRPEIDGRRGDLEAPWATPSPAGAESVAAATAMLEEARALRSALERNRPNAALGEWRPDGA